MDVDPEVHRVRDNQFGVFDLLEYLQLDGWGTVGKEDKGGGLITFGKDWAKRLEDIEIYFQSFPVIHVGKVFTFPGKCLFSSFDLESLCIDISGGK